MYNEPGELERQYNQEYDLSSDESDSFSNLSSRSAYIFKDVEKFDFQAMLTRKKAQDAKKAESKLNTTSSTGLKMIRKLIYCLFVITICFTISLTFNGVFHVFCSLC